MLNILIKNRIVFLSSIPIIILVVAIIPSLSTFVVSALEKASISIGGQFESVIIILSPIVILVWLWLIVIKRKYLEALGFQIALFPITYKASSILYVVAYSNSSAYQQKISLTTALLIIHFLILTLKKIINRPRNRTWHKFEFVLMSYAILLTATQFFSHDISSAILLSLGAVWQYVILFYMLSSLIKTSSDVVFMIQSFVAFTLLNILFRVYSDGQIWFSQLGTEIFRVGSGAMGPAVSYGGYLAIIITFAYFLYKYKGNWIYIPIMLALLLELMATFTRGGIVSLFILGVTVFWKSERKYNLKVITSMSVVAIFTGNFLWQYISTRGFELDIMKLKSVSIRFEIALEYFRELFSLSITGDGIGNFTYIYISGIKIAPHNIIIATLMEAGIGVTLVFVFMIMFSIKVGFRYSLESDRGKSIISLYLMIALLQWIFFANTTSTLINWYYPYEGSTIFWFTLFAPFLISGLSERYT
jgi:hypothetical protein